VDELATVIGLRPLSPPVPMSDEEFNELLRQSSNSRVGVLAMLVAVSAFVVGIWEAASAFVH
jgi:hypothetical protein